MTLPRDAVRRLSGFGFSAHADGYVVPCATEDDLRRAFALARANDRPVVLRGAGRSYGDAAYRAEAVVLDLTPMNQIEAWDPATGRIIAQAGVDIDHLWRRTLPDGWWPPVVSGTSFTTVGGALAMNIHGKNHFRSGSFAEHVVRIELMTPDGQILPLRPQDPRFRAVIGSAGLLGVVLRAEIQFKPVTSGDLRVLAFTVPDWHAQFEAMERYAGDANYLVSWVDLFATGSGAGRGVIHAAWYPDESAPKTLTLEHQALPSKILGLVPKSQVWRALRPLNRRAGMRFINAAKYLSSRIKGNGKEHCQSLVAFSFLLDYVPDWRRAYEPDGFVQFQAFVPRAAAQATFAELARRAQAAGQEAFLGVLKRHRPDPFLLTWALDGYSLAMDFRVNPALAATQTALFMKMTETVLSAGGRFYLAKDSTLTAAQFRAYLGPDAIAAFAQIHAQMDPEGLLTSALSERLGLDQVGPASPTESS